MTGIVDSCVAQPFLDLVDTAGVPAPGGTLVRFHLSGQDVADLAGTTVETAILIMSRWDMEEIVMTEAHGLLVRDVDRLRALAV